MPQLIAADSFHDTLGPRWSLRRRFLLIVGSSMALWGLILVIGYVVITSL